MRCRSHTILYHSQGMVRLIVNSEARRRHMIRHACRKIIFLSKACLIPSNLDVLYQSYGETISPPELDVKDEQHLFLLVFPRDLAHFAALHL